MWIVCEGSNQVRVTSSIRYLYGQAKMSKKSKKLRIFYYTLAQLLTKNTQLVQSILHAAYLAWLSPKYVLVDQQATETRYKLTFRDVITTHPVFV
jgi:hypothetical protein